MANHKSAIKAMRRADKNAIANHSRLSRIKTFIRRVEKAALDKNKDVAQTELRHAESEIMRGVQHNLFHINNGARKISRLTRLVKAIA